MSKKQPDLAPDKLLRQKAEEKLKQQPVKESPILESDNAKLLHELRVHQIELEMQNQELREANETAEQALKKYTMLYDFAPMGYFTLSNDGTICDLNFTGADLLGESRFALVDSNFKLFISKESQKTFNDFFSKIYSSNTKESCEVTLGYENQPLCQVYMEGVVTYDEQQTLLSVFDISGLSKTNP
jgi:PAS domain-containing protein